MMKLLLRISVPVAVLAASAAVVAWLMMTRPEAELRQPPSSIQTIEATRLVRTNYQVLLESQGTVRPRTQSTLKPEVSGRVLGVSQSFREGGIFEEGEVLLQIDPRDYQTAVVVAEAALKLKISELELEKAQHEQAKENWALLGDDTDPSPLTLREPQLAEALADVQSTRARLEQANRDLERTDIVAPYAGRIQRKMVDVGQVVTPGNELATIFAIDFVEVRLPIRNDQLDFIALPEEYRGEHSAQEQQHPRVILRGTYGSRNVNWEGVIIRAEGAYDDRTRELFVVAQVDDPYAHRGDNEPPLKVGQFVRATIFGKVLLDVFVVPRSALRDNREVLVVDTNNTIHRREVQVAWKDEESVVIREGLEEGEVLCTTPLVFAADGAVVQPTFDGQAPRRQGSPGGSGGEGELMGSDRRGKRRGEGGVPDSNLKPKDRS
jgi:RND family efflux transporter MFP subunit